MARISQDLLFKIKINRKHIMTKHSLNQERFVLGNVNRIFAVLFEGIQLLFIIEKSKRQDYLNRCPISSLRIYYQKKQLDCDTTM